MLPVGMDQYPPGEYVSRAKQALPAANLDSAS